MSELSSSVRQIVAAENFFKVVEGVVAPEKKKEIMSMIQSARTRITKEQADLAKYNEKAQDEMTKSSFFDTRVKPDVDGIAKEEAKRIVETIKASFKPATEFYPVAVENPLDAKLQAANQALIAEKEELSRRLSASSGEFTRVQGEIFEKTAELQAKIKQIEELRAQITRLEGEKAELAKQNAALEGELRNLQMKLDRNAKSLRLQEALSNDLQRQLNQKNARVAELERQLSAKTTELSAAQARVGQIEAQLAESNRRAEALQASLDAELEAKIALTAQMAVLINQMDDMRETLEGARLAIPDMNKRIRLMDQTAAAITRELEETKGLLRRTAEEKEAETRKVTELEARIKLADSNALILARELAKLELEQATLRADLRQRIPDGSGALADELLRMNSTLSAEKERLSSSLDALRAESSRLQLELAQAQQASAASAAANGAQAARIVTLEQRLVASVEALRESKTNLAEFMRDALGENQSLQGKLEQLRREVAELKDANARLTDANARLASANGQQNSVQLATGNEEQIDEKQERIRVLEGQIEQLRSALQAKDQELAGLRQQSAEQDAKIAALEAENADLIGAKKGLEQAFITDQKSIEGLKARIGELEAAQKQANEYHAAELERLKTEKEALRQQLDDALAANAKGLEFIKNQTERLNALRLAAKAQEKVYESQLAKLREEMAEMRSRFDEQAEKMAAQEVDRQSLEEAHKAASEKLKEEHAEALQALRAEFEAKEKALTQAMQREPENVSAFTEEVSRLRGELAELKSTHAGAIAEFRSVHQAEIAKLRGESATSAADLANAVVILGQILEGQTLEGKPPNPSQVSNVALQSMLIRTATKLAELNRRLTEATKQSEQLDTFELPAEPNNTYEEEIKTLKAQMKELLREKDSELGRITQLEGDLATKEGEIKALSDQLARVEGERKAAVGERDTANAARALAEEKLKASREQLKAAQEQLAAIVGRLNEIAKDKGIKITELSKDAVPEAIYSFVATMIDIARAKIAEKQKTTVELSIDGIMRDLQRKIMDSGYHANFDAELLNAISALEEAERALGALPREYRNQAIITLRDDVYEQVAPLRKQINQLVGQLQDLLTAWEKNAINTSPEKLEGIARNIAGVTKGITELQTYVETTEEEYIRNADARRLEDAETRRQLQGQIGEIEELSSKMSEERVVMNDVMLRNAEAFISSVDAQLNNLKAAGYSNNPKYKTASEALEALQNAVKSHKGINVLTGSANVTESSGTTTYGYTPSNSGRLVASWQSIQQGMASMLSAMTSLTKLDLSGLPERIEQFNAQVAELQAKANELGAIKGLFPEGRPENEAVIDTVKFALGMLSDRLGKVSTEADELREDLEALEKENRALKEENRALKSEVESQIRQIDRLVSVNGRLDARLSEAQDRARRSPEGEPQERVAAKQEEGGFVMSKRGLGQIASVRRAGENGPPQGEGFGPVLEGEGFDVEGAVGGKVSGGREVSGGMNASDAVLPVGLLSSVLYYGIGGLLIFLLLVCLYFLAKEIYNSQFKSESPITYIPVCYVRRPMGSDSDCE